MAINAGVIGCGNISKFHFAGLEKIGAKVSWVCDLNPNAAKPYMEKFGAAYTADYHQVLADKAVDVVFVTVISSLHKRICMDAINAGKAVICEKTLAENAADSLEIVTLAEKKNTLLYTSYMKRFIPAVAKAKELLPSIGQIFSTYIRTYQPWGNFWQPGTSEVQSQMAGGSPSAVVRAYGGGVLVCGGSHILDLVCFFLGRPTRLYAAMVQPEWLDFDLLASAMLETPNGIVHWEAAAHPLNQIGFLRDGWDEQIEINGTRGRLSIYSAKWDEVTFKGSLLVHYDNATGQSTEYRYGPGSPFDGAVAFFCRAIEEGSQGSQSRLTGYEVDELISHIKKSAATKQALEIQWKK
jgi:predicted dehydrogenase